MKYTKEIKEKVKLELLHKNGRTSNQIAKKLQIPDHLVRKLAVEYNLKFGHYTPFKSNKPIHISNELNDIIIGSLLGDGCISKYKFDNQSRTNKNSKLAIKHSIKQKEYVDYKFELLSKHCKSYIKSYQKYDNRINWNNSISYEVDTLQNVSFNKYRDIWYPNNIK